MLRQNVPCGIVAYYACEQNSESCLDEHVSSTHSSILHDAERARFSPEGAEDFPFRISDKCAV